MSKEQNEPKILAYGERDRNSFIPSYRGGTPAPKPYSSLTISSGLLPIAETSTLPPDFYTNVGLDTRYPRDRLRKTVNDKLKTIPGLSPAVLNLAQAAAIDGQDFHAYTHPVDGEDIEPDRLVGLLEPYAVLDSVNLNIVRRRFLSTPRPLREIAATDIDTNIQSLQFFSELDGISGIVDKSSVVDYLEAHGITTLRGQERTAGLQIAKTDLGQIVAHQRQQEDEVIGSGTEEGYELQRERIGSIRALADGIDALTFATAVNTGTIVNPAYLMDTSLYVELQREPELPLEDKIDFLRHMIAGDWPMGHDHTFLYRNKDLEIANSHAGVPSDFSAIRPGNFLFHDLKLLEYGPYKEDFPLEMLNEYYINHYLRAMDMHILDNQGQLNNNEVTLFQPTVINNTHYGLPLEKRNEAVIPFRALKKDLSSSEYYEYGEECYMAELVDMALQLDLIEDIRGTQETDLVTQIGDISVGKHTSKLLRTLRGLEEEKLPYAALATEQVLFMHGREASGGRSGIEDGLLTLDSKGRLVGLSDIETTQEYDQNGNPVNKRLPLTCYYEWFQAHAKPVSREDLGARGIPIVRPLFDKAA